ncbi:uncharacterized protein LOC131665372 [Phymastichus coffea]|uniref:uncharacterized protein LOC131665372 n=1 Tax=Phymastichus coffea TaxID=108790 RepID=UPI00273A967D|nr:uncharacterized protein LOC131665372 [Phymastichus coffea]
MFLKTVILIGIFISEHSASGAFDFGTSSKRCSNSEQCNESCITKHAAISGQCERRHSDYFDKCYCRVKQETCKQYVTSNYVFEQCDWNPGICIEVCARNNYEGAHCEPHYRVKKVKLCNCYRTLQECGELDVFFRLPEEEIF